jgi:hypothetical protein
LSSARVASGTSESVAAESDAIWRYATRGGVALILARITLRSSVTDMAFLRGSPFSHTHTVTRRRANWSADAALAVPSAGPICGVGGADVGVSMNPSGVVGMERGVALALAPAAAPLAPTNDVALWSSGIVSSLDDDELPLSSSLSVESDSSDSAMSDPSAVAVAVPTTASPRAPVAVALVGCVAAAVATFRLSGLIGRPVGLALEFPVVVVEDVEKLEDCLRVGETILLAFGSASPAWRMLTTRP